MGFRKTLLDLAMGIALLAPLPALSAEAEWKPSNNMEMVVASGVGTAYDVLARAMARLWPKHFEIGRAHV